LETLKTPEYTAECADWMIRQPDDWSGHVVGFDDITALGGPEPGPPAVQ